MADGKKAGKRPVSKARFLLLIDETIADYGLTAESTVGELVAAVEAGIVTDAKKALDR